MQRVVWVGLLAVSGGGCGNAAPPKPEPPPARVVAVPPASASEDEPEAKLDAGPGRAEPRHDLAGCVLEMRSGASVRSQGEDRSAFERAFSAERAGNLDEARKGYFEVVQNHPSSLLIPLAYLAFGELFAEEAERGDASKWELARAAYQEVLKYPPPDNVAVPYAWLRLGDSRAGDAAQALASYARALEAARQYPALPCAEPIGERARARLIEAFSQAGAPDKAWAFFRAKDGEARAREMLLGLAKLYRQKGDPKSACAALKAAPADPELDQEKNAACAGH